MKPVKPFPKTEHNEDEIMNISEQDGQWIVEINCRVLVSHKKEQEKYLEVYKAISAVNVTPDTRAISLMVLNSLFQQEHLEGIKATSKDHFEFRAFRNNQPFFRQTDDASQYSYHIMFREKSDAMMLKLRLGGAV